MDQSKLTARIALSACLLCALAACATVPAPTTPHEMLTEGDRLASSKHYEEAINQWKKVKEGDYAPELAAQAELKIADAEFADKKYIEAAASYENFHKMHPSHPKAAYALYRLALSYYNEITGIDTEQTPVKNTVTVLENFLRQYPDSEYAPEVRKKLEDCRTKQLQYEIYIGRFYYRTEKYPSAIKRLEQALAAYPEAAGSDELLYYLGSAYLKNGDKAKGQEILARLVKEIPQSNLARDAAQVLK